MEDVSFGLAFLAGLLSFVSPCVLPLVPAYVGYMGGRATRNVSLELETNKAKTGTTSGAIAARANMLLHGLAFVLGFTVVFVLIGLMTTAFVSTLGSSVSVLTDIIGRVGGIVIITFGLHFMGMLRKLFMSIKARPALLGNVLTTPIMLALGAGVILWAFVTPMIALPILAAFALWLVLDGAFTEPGTFWKQTIERIEVMLYSDTRREMEPNKATGLGGSFIMGVVFSAGWTPCIGPLLGTILTIAAQRGDVAFAVPMLAAYSLGLGIPFLLTALLMEGAQSILRRLQRHMHKIELGSGLLLVLIGIMVATGTLQNLSQSVSGDTADVSIRIEECGIGFARGQMSFDQARSCLSGNLHRVELGQSAGGELNAETTQMQYLIDLEEAQVVDVELSRVDQIFPALVVIEDQDGVEVARSNELMQFDETKYLAIYDLELPAGRYTITISQDSVEPTSFRLKMSEHDPEKAVIETQASVGSIEGLAAASGLAIGNVAPDFTATTVAGDPIALSDLRGQVVLLNFWGTWCGPCRREMPELQEVYEAHEDDTFTILAIAVRDTDEAILDFAEEFDLTFDFINDAEETITNLYGIIGQPSTVIIDQDGVIVFNNPGIVLGTQIEEILGTVLN